MRWDDPAPVSADGTVIFHAGDEASGLHLECSAVKPYWGRLRAWTNRGAGPLVHDELVALAHDLRDPVPEQVSADWMARCRQSAGMRPTEPGAARSS